MQIFLEIQSHILLQHELHSSTSLSEEASRRGRAVPLIFWFTSSRRTARVLLCGMMCACFMHRWIVDITQGLCVCLLKHTCSRSLRVGVWRVVHSTGDTISVWDCGMYCVKCCLCCTCFFFFFQVTYLYVEVDETWVWRDRSSFCFYLHCFTH